MPTLPRASEAQALLWSTPGGSLFCWSWETISPGQAHLPCCWSWSFLMTQLWCVCWDSPFPRGEVLLHTFWWGTGWTRGLYLPPLLFATSSLVSCLVRQCLDCGIWSWTDLHSDSCSAFFWLYDLSSTICWKRFSSSIQLSWHLCQKPWPYICASICGFSILFYWPVCPYANAILSLLL